MIPVLYNHAEKDFLSNGLGRLTDCISCTVTEERNGVFTCEFEYPIFGRHYEDISEGCIIFVTHDNSGIPQPFDVYRRSVPIDGVVTFEASHISYRLSNVVLKPYTATSCASALANIPAASMNECEFTFITDKNVDANFSLTYPIAAKAILCGVEGSILDVYGTGEYKYDNFQVGLYTHRGVDTDVQIRYGKNLVDMLDEYDSSASYNAVVPYWVSPEDGSVKTLPEYAVVATYAPGYTDFWTDDNGEFMTDENDERFEFDYVVLKPATFDLSQYFETMPTNAQMRQKAKQAADEHANPARSISVDFVQLWQSEEYANFAPLQQLNLCDTAEVIYNGESVRLKVIRTEYDVLRDRYTRLELGDQPESYADVVTGELSEKLKIVPSKMQMQAAITSATEKITGVQGGNVVIVQEDGKPQEILIMDAPDIETAVHVLRINMNGIGFSETGVNGEYHTAWTLDGTFFADFIRAGTLNGERINGGSIASLNGQSTWDLDNGRFYNVSTGGFFGVRLRGGGIQMFRTTDGDIENLTPTFTIGAYASGTGEFEQLYAQLNAGSLRINKSTGVEMLSLSDSQIRSYIPTRFDDDVYFMDNCTAYGAIAFIGNTFDSNAYIKRYSTISGQAFDRLYIRGPHIEMTDGTSAVPASYNDYGILLLTSSPVYVQNELTAMTLTQRSDEHLKNVRAYEGAYDDVIDELEPITFTWKDGVDTCEHVGLGARKTKDTLNRHGLTDAGFSRDIGGTYVMNYNELTVMLLKRVQDLTRRVEELEGMLCK